MDSKNPFDDAALEHSVKILTGQIKVFNAQHEGRELSRNEQKALEELEAELAAAEERREQAQEDRARKIEERRALLDRVETEGRTIGHFDSMGHFVTHDTTPAKPAAMSARGADGKVIELRSFKLGENLRAGMQPSRAGIGAIVRALATGDWSRIPAEQRSVLSSGAAAAVPGYDTLGIYELAMQESRIFAAGARAIPMSSPQAKIARLVSAPEVEFAAEDPARDLTDGAFTFETGVLDAYSAFLYTTASIEALEDVVNLEGIINSTFARQLALQFDKSGLGGAGTDQPLGIGRMTHALHRVNEITGVGEPTSYLPFVRGAGMVMASFHTPSAVMMPTDVWTDLQCLTETTTGQPLNPPRAYEKLTEYVSDMLPQDLGTGEDEMAAIVGDFTKLLVGMRTELTLEVSRTGTGFKRGLVEIRGYCRFGTLIEDPTAFCVLSGITPSSVIESA